MWCTVHSSDVLFMFRVSTELISDPEACDWSGQQEQASPSFNSRIEPGFSSCVCMCMCVLICLFECLCMLLGTHKSEFKAHVSVE